MTDPTPRIEDYTLDDELIEDVRADRMPRLRIYAPGETIVVIGRGSRPEIELHLHACADDGVPVRKRRGGGCSVVLDPGNVIVSLAVPFKGIGDNRKHLARLSGWLIDGLAKTGVPGVKCRGISDLALGDRKIGGSCLYRAKDLLYYSSTLLVDPDLDRIDRYLKHPPREPDYRRRRSHREFLDSLSFRGYPKEVDHWTAALRRVLLPGGALAALKPKAQRACL